jgi:hypothetical protein
MWKTQVAPSMKNSRVTAEATIRSLIGPHAAAEFRPALPAPGVRLLRGRNAIAQSADMLRELGRRTGQASAVHWLEYDLSTPSALKKNPTLALVGLDDAVEPAKAGADDLIGAVLLYEYRVAGFGLRIFATDDATGLRGVIAPAHLRLQVAEAACQQVLDTGALAAMVTFAGKADEDGKHAGRRPSGDFEIARRTRTVPVYLGLGPTHEETLATLGKHTRRNLRYYRRRLEAEVGVEFVPQAALSRQEFLRLNRASINPVAEALAGWRYDTIEGTPGSMLQGLRSRSGQWLSVIGGRRYGPELHIDWQMNMAGLPRYSLSTVMRSYTLEYEIGLGTEWLAFTGGTPHSMRHSFLHVDAADVIAVRRSTAGLALRRFASWIFPEKNFLRSALEDEQLHWS